MDRIDVLRRRRPPLPSVPAGAGAPIVLWDDHIGVQDAVAGLLKRCGAHVAAQETDGTRAARLAATIPGAVAVINFLAKPDPARNPYEVFAQTARNVKIVVIAEANDEVRLSQALSAGALGYLSRTDGITEVIDAIQQVASGSAYISSDLARTVLRIFRMIEPRSEGLSSYQRRIVQLVAEGLSTRQIATALSVSERTVESRRADILKVLGVRDTAAVVRYAIRNGITQV